MESKKLKREPLGTIYVPLKQLETKTERKIR